MTCHVTIIKRQGTRKPQDLLLGKSAFYSWSPGDCLRADVSYFLCCTRKRDDVPFPRATKEIGEVCTQATRETNAKFPYCWPVTTQIWVLLQISWSKFPTRHDQSGSRFCARFSDVFFAGKPVLALRNVSCFVRLGRFTQNRVGNCTNYLRIALGAWPPTTYITLGKPIGVLGRVLGDCTEDRWSFVSKWYFIASIKKSLHMLLFLTSASVSTRLTRYSRDRRGSRTCSINCARQSCLCSGSWLTQATTASNTWKFLKRKLID